MNGLISTSRKELEMYRNKLIKLEEWLSFKLESEDLQPHLHQALEAYLQELTNIINKTPKVY